MNIMYLQKSYFDSVHKEYTCTCGQPRGGFFKVFHDVHFNKTSPFLGRRNGDGTNTHLDKGHEG